MTSGLKKGKILDPTGKYFSRTNISWIPESGLPYMGRKEGRKRGRTGARKKGKKGKEKKERKS